MRAVLAAFLIAGLTAPATSDAIVQPLAVITTRSIGNASSRVAVPFGRLDGLKLPDPSEPSLVTVEALYDSNNIATDAVWARHVAKGSWYGCLLDMKDELCGMMVGDTRNPKSAESFWQGDLRQSIFTWGWYDTYYDADTSCDFRNGNNKIQSTLDALGISYLPFGKGGDNECYSLEHYDETLLPDDDDSDDEDKNPSQDGNHAIKRLEDQTYTVDGRTYPATGAYYRFAVNKRGGAIFAQHLLKPQAAAVKELGLDIPEDQMPHLQRASDIIWSYWERNNPNPQNIRYYIVNNVQNEQALPLIARALRTHKLDKVPDWPGLELGIKTDEAEAILGSPIGSTIVHFLLQHKKTLGVKNVDSITIFREYDPKDLAPEVQLLFKIIDVQFDEQMPDVDGKAKRMEPFQAVMEDRGKNIVREHRIVVGL